MRHYIFLGLLLTSIFNVSGQVDSRIHFENGRNAGEFNVVINWSDRDELKWKKDNLPHLEIMAIRTDFNSAMIPVSSTNTSAYLFSLSAETEIELLLEIEQMANGEYLNLVDNATGKTLFSTSNKTDTKFLLPSIHSSRLRLEWINSTGINYKSKFFIKRIFVHDHITERDGRGIGYGTALACIPNAACKQDSILQLISKSSVRIRMVMAEGIGWCSGSFVNNTRNDKTPYILTAYHCTFNYTPEYDLWRFDIQYRTDSCANTIKEPLLRSLTGCVLKAGRQASDFILLELEDDPPSNYEITFAGWRRDETNTPDTSYLAHHPNADVRKFSTCTNKALVHGAQINWSEGYSTPPNYHYRFKFTEGGHQPGSSGGPVFNQDGYLIGQLHGGVSGCESLNVAYTGRLSKSWDQGTTINDRLKDWLDPDATGVTTLAALENLAESDMAEIHGTVVDPFGRPIKNVAIVISGGLQDTVVTDDEGHFILTDVNRNGQYHITPLKDDNQTNGINVIDLIAIQKHLLGKDTLDFPWQFIAADATSNDDLSVGDILVLLRLLLGKITHLPSTPSWKFQPELIDVNTIPPGGPMEVHILGIKIGDLNGSSDPGQ